MKEMPLQSVLKFLGKMTASRVLEPGSPETQAVCERIQCETTLKKAGFQLKQVCVTDPELLCPF